MSVATAVARSATRSTSTISRADARSRRANAHAWPTRPAPTTPTFSIIVPAPYAAAAKRSTKPAARAPASFARAHAASSRARARGRASLGAPCGASAFARGRASRRGSRTPAPAQSTRADVSFMSPAAGTQTGTHPPRRASATVPWPAWQTTASQRGIVLPYGTQSTSVAFAGIGTSSARRSVLASTRTGRPASPASAARRRRCSRSCDVDGASSTSGSSPSGSATSFAGGSQRSGPTTWVDDGHARGYSSCGNVATRHSAREIPPCTCASGGSPSRARVSLSSRRPRSRPPAMMPSVARHIRRPAAVRGRRAPIEYGGIPGSPRGSVWGMSVATGTPSSSPASAGASVRTSFTIASGRSSATSGRVSPTARTTASYGASGFSSVGKTWYSGAGSKRMPSSSTCDAQRRHVCSTTSWPRATSARPSAIIGNACPGSPKAPSSSLRGSGFTKLGDEAQLLDALLLRSGDRRDPERADACVAVDGEPLAHVVGRPAQRHGVDELVGHRGGRLVALAVEVEVLDLLRRRLEAVAHGERVVEVLLARAHAADVQRDERPHPVARGQEVVADRDVDRRRDVEAVERAVRPRRALLEQRPQIADVYGREEDRDPAVGDLAGELRVLRPDRREGDRDPFLPRRDRQLERLARPVGQRQLERLSVELEPLAV